MRGEVTDLDKTAGAGLGMKKAVILDRDGVINDHKDYVHTPDDLILFDFSAPAIRLLREAEFSVVVATNQGGVGLGYLTEQALDDVHEKMRAELAEQGAIIDDIVSCIHAPKAGCTCRKPRPGLLYALQARNDLDLSKSYMVGDRETDVQAGQAAGTRTVRIGEGPSAADHVASTLLTAVHWILEDASTRK